MSDSNAPNSIEDLSNWLSKSEYDKVIFYDVAESYSTDADVECKYTVTSGIIPAHGDRVALFKIGWTAPHQYMIYEWAPVSEQGNNSTDVQVLFQAKDLPKDDGEFYQFCYISAEGSIRGASIPFRFRRPSLEDLVEVEDDDSDLLIIRSRTAVIEEKMREVAVKNSQLLKSKSVIDKELEKEREQNTEMTMKLKDYEQKIKKLQNILEEETHKHEEEIDKLKEQFEAQGHKAATNLKQIQLQQMQDEAFVKELQNTVNILSQQNEEFNHKIAAEKKERDSLMKEHSSKENQLKASIQKTEHLSKELVVQQEATKCLQQQVKFLESSLRDQQQKNQDLRGANIVLEDDRKRIVDQLLDTEHMLAAMEKSKYLATEEIMAHAEFKEKVTKDLENTRCDVHSLKCRLKCLQDDHEKQLQENKKLHEELSILEKNYSILKADHEELLTQQKLWQKTEQSLKNTVHDLIQRLKTGATEYQSKYIESLKLEKKVNKLKKKIQEKQGPELKTKSEVTVEEKADEKVSNDYQVKSAETLYSTSKSSSYPTVPKSYAVYYTMPNKPFPITLPNEGGEAVGGNGDILGESASNASCNGLPPPIMPEVTPKAKLIAIAAVNRQISNQSIPDQTEQNPAEDLEGSFSSISLSCPTIQGSSQDEDNVSQTSQECPICNLTFLGPDVERIFQDHVEAHYGFDCPVCSMHYNPDQTAQLEMHVQSHFINESHTAKYEVNFD